MRQLLLIIICLFISSFGYANNELDATRAYILFKMQKFEEAIKICESVLEKDKDNIDALYVAGISHFMIKNYFDADKYFQRMLNINPYNYDITKYSAISKFYYQDYKGSISYFEKIPRYMEDPIVLLYLALNYNRLKDNDNLQILLNKIENNPKIQHQNKGEFIDIIKKAISQQDVEETINNLKNLREKYNNQFVISSKIISIEKNTQKESDNNLRLLISLNEVFDTNVALYPDKDAVKLPDVKYDERYDLRSEARYSIGYRLINTPNHLFGVQYRGYQGINANLYQYNFNSNALQVFYRYLRPTFHLDFSYNYSYDFISDKFKAYAFAHKVIPEFFYRSSNFEFGVGFPIYLRHYFEKVFSEDYNRSSMLIDPYLLLSYSVTPSFSIYNKDFLGINNAEGDGWKYIRPEVRLGMNYKYGTSIYLNISGGFGYYMFSEKISNPNYIFDKNASARTDSKLSLEASIDFKLYSDKLFLNTAYALISNMSNVKNGIFDYTRHISSVGIKFVY